MNVYLDYAATTPLDGEVLRCMTPYFTEMFGNAGSMHAWGQQARHAVDRARQTVAACLGARANEIYFTSGGTESDNWALRGAMSAHHSKGKHLVVSCIEHQAVLYTAKQLQQEGYDVTFVPVTSTGVVDMAALRAAVRPDTVLVSVMTANNLTGVVQPIAEIAALAHSQGALMHTDAVQAIGAGKLDVQTMDVDLLSLSAHKIYGPKGVGALYVRNGVTIGKLLDGGEQERNRRAGTLNTAGVVGLAAAMRQCVDNDAQNAQTADLRNRLQAQITSQVGDVLAVGADAQRLPAFCYLCFGGVKAAALLACLDMAGIAVSAGSACSAGTLQRNYVLEAMGVVAHYAEGGVRFTLGRQTTQEHIDYTVQQVAQAVEQLRRNA